MDFYLKKTGRYFKSQEAITNHIRSVYGVGKENVEKAYKENNNLIETPICPVCKTNKLKFRSFTKGYSHVCSNKCANKLIGENKKNSYKNGYDEFIKNNIQWYRDNYHKTEIYDIFDNSYTGKKTLSKCIPLKIKNKGLFTNDYWFIEKDCKFCGKKFKLHILRDDLSKNII